MNPFKWDKNRLGQLGCPYFSHEKKKKKKEKKQTNKTENKKKKNKMYLSFGKSCSKLLDIKYITLNSPLISRMSLVKQINTCSIILKLYKFQHY